MPDFPSVSLLGPLQVTVLVFALILYIIDLTDYPCFPQGGPWVYSMVGKGQEGNKGSWQHLYEEEREQ